MKGRMEVEDSLHEAAILGDVELLDQVVERDPLILDRVSVGSLVHTPLHVTAFRGHLEFVRRLLSKNPDLAGVLDQRRWSALHLAAAKGHRSVVKELVQANPDMCTTLDADGRNLLHLATIKQKIDVLIELFETQPHRIGELLSTRDANDDTVFHLAVKNLEPETLERFLLHTKAAMEEKPASIEKVLNTINKGGFTPLDILEQTKMSKQKIEYTLRAVGCLNAKEINQGKRLLKNRESLMVVASLIASMTFQATLSPPGGTWQDNKGKHRAGESVMGSNWPTLHSSFVVNNTIGFVGSLLTIFFLAFYEPLFKNVLFEWFLLTVMGETAMCTFAAYLTSIVATATKKDWLRLRHSVSTPVFIFYGWTWCVIVLVISLVVSCRLGYKSCLTMNKTQNARKEVEKKVKEIQEQRGTAVLVQPEIVTDIEVSSPPS